MEIFYKYKQMAFHLYPGILLKWKTAYLYTLKTIGIFVDFRIIP